MEVQAKWENGVLRPLKPLNFKHSTVIIQVPDDALAESPESDYELSSEALAIAEAMTAEIDEILNAPLPPSDDLPEPTPKQIERMAAYALREDR